jgi:ATP:corrinoid adenosyltransferase
MLKFYHKNHPYGWLEADLMRYDPDLRLAYNKFWKWWQVVRRVRIPEVVKVDESLKMVAMQTHWATVRDCIWEDRTPRKPSDWLMMSIFGSRIQVKTLDEAADNQKSKRKWEKEQDVLEEQKRDQVLLDGCREALPAFDREVVTVDGLKQ